MAKPTKRAIEMLQPVLEWLDQGAKHKKVNNREIGFNMDHFTAYGGAKDYQNKSCGAACCIAGAVYQFNKEALTEALVPNSIMGVGKAMGMTPRDTNRLFYAADVSDIDHSSTLVGSMIDTQMTPEAFEHITPATAATTIRNWIETGKITWK